MGSRILGALASASVALLVCACGGQADVTASPTACAAALSPASQNVSGAGGTFAVSITVSPGCEWTASADAGWVTLMRTSGAGSGSAAFTVAQNVGADGRSARIRIGDESVVVMQSPGDCSYSIDPSSASIAASGGTTEFRVNTGDGCTWSASASDSWISLSATSGTGARTLSASIAPNTAMAPRSGSIQLEGRTFTVSQLASGSTPDPAPAPAPGPGSCTFDVSPREHTIDAAGARLEIRLVASGETCAWSAGASASWIRLDRSSGNGSATLLATVAANDAPQFRVATIEAGGADVTVNQSGVSEQPSCAVTLSPSAFNIAAAGGAVTLDVTTGPGCAWRTDGRPGWIHQDPSSGSGSVRVRFTVDPNPLPSARSATIGIGNRGVTFSQAATCAYSVNPTSLSVGPLGGPAKVDLMTQPSCKWTVSDAAKWITSVSPASGSGPATISFHVGLNEQQAERKATLQIETARAEITQAANVPCEFTFSPTSQSVPAEGGRVEFKVITAAGCGWNPTTKDGWIEGISAAGRGPGAVTATVTPNPVSTGRSGGIDVGGKTFGITQAAAPRCTLSVSWPLESTITAAPTGQSVDVSVRASCTWTASAPDWITGVSPGEHRGDANFKLSIACNATGLERRGTVTIGNRTATIVQSFDPRKCGR